MLTFVKALPLIVAMAAAPALAQPADPHAAHHPPDAAAAAKPDAKPDAKADEAKGCPMMAQMAPAKGEGHGAKSPDTHAMMKDGHMAHCMMADDAKTPAPAAKPAAPAPEHDHQHQ